MFSALFIIRKYVAYKLKPIYSIVLSRDVHTTEILDELKDKRVENIGEELTAWADTNDKEIERLKESERFRKRRSGGRADQPQVPRTGREEHRPAHQHRERPRYHFEARKQHEPLADGAVRHRGAGARDRGAGRDGGRPQAYPHPREGCRQPAVAFLGAGRQALRRSGAGQSHHQLDPLRPRGRHDERPVPRHARPDPDRG